MDTFTGLHDYYFLHTPHPGVMEHYIFLHIILNVETTATPFTSLITVVKDKLIILDCVHNIHLVVGIVYRDEWFAAARSTPG